MRPVYKPKAGDKSESLCKGYLNFEANWFLFDLIYSEMDLRNVCWRSGEGARNLCRLPMADGCLPSHKSFTIAFTDGDGASAGSRMTFMSKPFLSGAQAQGGNQNGVIKIDSANNLYIIKSSRTNQSCGSILGCCKCLAFGKAYPGAHKKHFSFYLNFYLRT